MIALTLVFNLDVVILGRSGQPSGWAVQVGSSTILCLRGEVLSSSTVVWLTRIVGFSVSGRLIGLSSSVWLRGCLTSVGQNPFQPREADCMWPMYRLRPSARKRVWQKC